MERRDLRLECAERHHRQAARPVARDSAARTASRGHAGSSCGWRTRLSVRSHGLRKGLVREALYFCKSYIAFMPFDPEILAAEKYCYLTTTGRATGKKHMIEVWLTLSR